jgi:hypothetical protein
MKPPNWQHVATHILVNCPEYRWELEEHRDPDDNQMMFAHITVHKLAPGLLKRMKETYRLFRQHVSCPLYAVAGSLDDAKWARFISHFDFQFLNNVVCENGEKRRLFVSFKKQEQNDRSIQSEPSPANQSGDQRGDSEHERHQPMERSEPVPHARVQRSSQRS